MVEVSKRKGLGRGLAALIDDVRPERQPQRQADTHAPIERLHPNPDQPRKQFDAAELESLAASIREKGVIQPLIVRPDPARPGEWQIVAGERRWRAAQMAQVHSAPIVIRNLDDAEVLEIAILENVQRADLNPIEEAAGYAQLVERFGHTQEQLATAMGKSRSYIANALRLLSLPEPVQVMTREGRLSAGHARALITSPNAELLARTVVDRGLSVRDTERLVKSRDGEKSVHPERRNPSKDADTHALEADLSAALGLAVTITPRGVGGEVRIAYSTLEQLDGLCQLLSHQAQA
ncbi:MAG: chromosome partitioning protein ParB [Rhodobacterales bacterium CG_4_9_14_3_um_filter_71_31]|nr:MAG: chromosome partitioning protein ParB [Rhodobacterales bacterium CG_4_9_14_3_um_filter_71_31]